MYMYPWQHKPRACDVGTYNFIPYLGSPCRHMRWPLPVYVFCGRNHKPRRQLTLQVSTSETDDNFRYIPMYHLCDGATVGGSHRRPRAGDLTVGAPLIDCQPKESLWTGSLDLEQQGLDSACLLK